MSKKVLIISASPRKDGNSDLLCNQFLKGALSAGHHAEKIALRGFTADCLDGAREKGIIYGTGAWQKGEVKNLPVFQEAYEAGKNC